VLPGTAGAAAVPQGDGYAAVVVGRDGTVTMTGYLADGTPLSVRSTVSKAGQWPLYAALYNAKGSVLGWVHFEDTATNDFHGQTIWIRPAQSGTRTYPAGFSVESEITGSRYVQPDEDERILDLHAGLVVLSGGGLPQTYINRVTLGEGGTVINADTNRLSMTFSLSNGLFRGSFTAAGTERRVTFGGAVLQKANAASGYYLGGGQSGNVLLRAADAP
jgi:hypothetical protein